MSHIPSAAFAVVPLPILFHQSQKHTLLFHNRPSPTGGSLDPPVAPVDDVAEPIPQSVAPPSPSAPHPPRTPPASVASSAQTTHITQTLTGTTETTETTGSSYTSWPNRARPAHQILGRRQRPTSEEGEDDEDDSEEEEEEREREQTEDSNGPVDELQSGQDRRRTASTVSTAGRTINSAPALTESGRRGRSDSSYQPPPKRMRIDDAAMLADSDRQVPQSSNGTVQLQNGKERARNSNATSSLAPPSFRSSTPHNPSAPGATTTTYFDHDRVEVTRILIQALSDLGYSDAADSVIRQSGYALESQPVSEFRQAVLSGDWAGAERLLLGAAVPESTINTGSGSPANLRASSAVSTAPGLSSIGDRTSASGSAGPASSSSLSNGSGLVLLPSADRSLMRFWIRQQKYLELLEQRETAKALSVLRNELAPLYQDTQKLHFLSSLLMCQSPEDIRASAEWDGAYGQSRQLLLSDLSRFISPSVMLPEHRLSVLLDQVKAYQVSTCVFHTSATSPSLYADHFCDKSNFPSHVMCELREHSGEVWQVRFSHDGKRLASCGIGHYVIIWDVPTFKVLLKLHGHGQGVGDIAWSPDDTMLVSCGRDNRARLWNTRTGLLEHLFEQFDEPVSSCVWAADGQSVVLGSFDKDRALCQWSLSGERLFTWTKKHRTEGLALSANGQWLVAMDHENQLHVYNFITRELEYDMDLTSRAMSVAISENSQYLLVNRQDGEIHMYNIAVPVVPMRKYVGGTGGDCIIRSSFGGADESFVVSGSEDGKLNIWHKNMGAQLFKLDAHKPRCNAVSWSPTDPCLFATCGDDNTIKIWSNSERVRQHELEAARNGVGPRSTSNGWRTDLADV